MHCRATVLAVRGAFRFPDTYGKGHRRLNLRHCIKDRAMIGEAVEFADFDWVLPW